MGSIQEPATYSTPREAGEVFRRQILNNALLPDLPLEIHEACQLVSFTGNDLPSMPLNWRFAESAAALKAFEASMLNVLRAKKFEDCKQSRIEINTDHASIYLLSPFMVKPIDPVTKKPGFLPYDADKLEAEYKIPNGDVNNALSSFYRLLVTNIYETKDHRWYHVHGSLNPEPCLKALGMPLEDKSLQYDEAISKYKDAVAVHESIELDEMMNDQYRQSGTICMSEEEYFASETGKANSHVGLYEITRDGDQPPSWWPDNASIKSSPARPLAGLKVVDLTRVVAGPTITRCLAEMGASVMRVTSPHVADLSAVHIELNWGKWNTYLHLTLEDDQQALRELILDADVVVDGYRPGVFERRGFGRQAIFDLVRDRSRGIIHVRENCYGWYGPWQHRSGWQQISDAICGVSHAYGKAMGLDEPVTPVLPNSDYCTGVIGSAAIMHALIRRAEHGGSYGVDVALNYYSQWLTSRVGEYPQDVWSDVWQRNGSPVVRHHDAMARQIPLMLGVMAKHNQDTLYREEFFENRYSKALGHHFQCVKPVALFADGVDLCFNVGTRGNGFDKARWPHDLEVEIVE